MEEILLHTNSCFEEIVGSTAALGLKSTNGQNSDVSVSHWRETLPFVIYAEFYFVTITACKIKITRNSLDHITSLWNWKCLSVAGVASLLFGSKI